MIKYKRDEVEGGVMLNKCECCFPADKREDLQRRRHRQGFGWHSGSGVEGHRLSDV